jgi:hypothetical protein
MKPSEFTYIKTTVGTTRVKESVDEITKLLELDSKAIRLTEYLRPDSGRPIIIMVNHIVSVFSSQEHSLNN